MNCIGKEKFIFNICRWLFGLSAMAVIIFLLWKNFSPLGEQIINYNFSGKNPFTAGLYPSTRVQPITCEQSACSQIIFSDPTYINLLMPRKFESLDVEIWHQNQNNFQFNVGLKTGAGWQYNLVHLDKIKTAGDWIIGAAHFNLNNAYLNKRQISLILSIPPLKGNRDSIKIKNIKFIFKKNSLFNKILNYDWIQ